LPTSSQLNLVVSSGETRFAGGTRVRLSKLCCRDCAAIGLAIAASISVTRSATSARKAQTAAANREGSCRPVPTLAAIAAVQASSERSLARTSPPASVQVAFVVGCQLGNGYFVVNICHVLRRCIHLCGSGVSRTVAQHHQQSGDHDERTHGEERLGRKKQPSMIIYRPKITLVNITLCETVNLSENEVPSPISAQCRIAN